MKAPLDERAVPIFPSDDLAAAKAFYVERLGFTVEWEDTVDGSTGIMGIRRGAIELVIDCPMTGHGRNVCASVRVNDADAWYAEWRDRVEIARPPADEAWGGRTFGVTDPFGNLLFMIGPVRDSDPSVTAGAAQSTGHAWPRPVFRVARLEASIAYYRDRLGFEVDWLDNSTSPPTCGQVSRDVITVILDERASFPKAAVPSVLSVTLDDSPAAPGLDVLHQDLVRSGGRIVRGPFAVSWQEELRQMDIEDLDGNVLMVWGHSAAPAEP